MSELKFINHTKFFRCSVGIFIFAFLLIIITFNTESIVEGQEYNIGYNKINENSNSTLSESENEGDVYNLLIEDEDYSDIDKLLKNSDYNKSFKEMINDIYNNSTKSYKLKDILKNISEVITANKKAMIQTVIIALISSMITSFGPVFNNKQLSDLSVNVITIGLITLLTAVYFGAVNTACEILNILIGAYKSLCVIFFPSVTLTSGNITSAAYYQIVIFMITAVDIFMKNVMVRANDAMMMISLCDCVDREEHFTKMCELIDKCIRMAGKVILSVFLGMNGIKSIINPITDSVKNSYFNKAVSLIPGVGNQASVISNSVMGAATMVKNSIGTAGIIALIAISLQPLLKLVALSIIYQGIAAVVEPMSDKRVVKAISMLSRAIGNLTYIVMIALVLMVLTMAVICLATNINYLS
ncbi:MAG: stage III sporulation protein AE [Lachnospira sp.]